jgi:hypothetical protein
MSFPSLLIGEGRDYLVIIQDTVFRRIETAIAFSLCASLASFTDQVIEPGFCNT